MDEERKLLPCPFCGSVPELMEGHRNHWRVECPRCGVRRAQFANGGVEEDKARAVRSWNTRPEEPMTDKVTVEKMARVLAPHLPTRAGCNPDCDDQASAQDHARYVASLALEALDYAHQSEEEMQRRINVLEDASAVEASGHAELVEALEAAVSNQMAMIAKLTVTRPQLARGFRERVLAQEVILAKFGGTSDE